jgi:dephospho-CoA kinase
MPIIGLTGSFGTGKTTVANLFAKRGAKVINADEITRALLNDNKNIIKKVAKAFPGAILSSGKVDRAVLSKIVFKHPRELKKLTDILYPEALKEVKRRISLNKRAKFIILDVPLLFEAKWDKLTDVNIVVRASRSLQFERLQKRMGLSKADILKRLKFQMPQTTKVALADMVIDNSGTLQETRQQVGVIINRLLQRSPRRGLQRTK